MSVMASRVDNSDDSHRILIHAIYNAIGKAFWETPTNIQSAIPEPESEWVSG